jgi:hypothetical protein
MIGCTLSLSLFIDEEAGEVHRRRLGEYQTHAGEEYVRCAKIEEV